MRIRPDFREAYGGVLYWWRATYPEDLDPGTERHVWPLPGLCFA